MTAVLPLVRHDPRRRRASQLLHPSSARAIDHLDLHVIAAGLATTARVARLDQHDDTRRYARALLTPRYDAWIIEWSASATLDFHDHGGSSGLVLVVEGELVETRIEPRSERAPRTTTAHPGDVIEIAPSTVHAVSNEREATALSVHVYSPPLSAMTYYGSGAARSRP